MDNNKNRLKDRPKTDVELRKIFSNAEMGDEIGVGLENAERRGSGSNGIKYNKNSSYPHNTKRKR